MEDKVVSPMIASAYNRDYLRLKNNYGEVLPFQLQIYAMSGHGKGLATESIIEEWRSQTGGIVLSIADPKAEAELSFVQYEPTAKYHVQALQRDGKPVKTYNCKMYHPFTFNIPKGYLPEINFFTIPINSLGRSEWSILAETPSDSDTIRMLMTTAESLPRNDGLIQFLLEIERRVEGKKLKGKRVRDMKNFGLRVGSATAKSITDISQLLYSFKNNYFLRKQSCPYALDWKTILQDHENYHVFLSMWVKDEKIKQFMVLHLLEKILENRHHAKRPILIVMPELKYLCPRNPEGYKKFLSYAITDSLSRMRSMGRGISSIGDSQSWGLLDDKIKDASTRTLFGQLGTGDQTDVCKSLNYRRDIREKLQNMPNNAYFIYGEESYGTFRIFLPSHAHKEPHDNWIEKYKEHYKQKTRMYDDMVEYMRNEYAEEEKELKELITREREQEKKEEEAKAREEQALKEGRKVEVKKEPEVDKDKERLMRLCWEMKQDMTLPTREKTDRRIAVKYGLSPKTAKRYYMEYAEVLEKRKNEGKTFVEEETREEDENLIL